MKRSRLFIFSILLVFIVVCICVEIRWEDAGSLENGMIQQLEEEEIESTLEIPQVNMEAAYELLNKDILGENSIKSDLSLLKEEIYRHTKDINGEFESTMYMGQLFPSELITLLEEKLYYLKENDKSNDVWYESLKELGADQFKLDLDDMYRLFPELGEYRNEIKTVYDAYNRIFPTSTRCTAIFHININPNENNYIFIYWEGGTNGAYSVQLTNKEGDEFIKIDEFHVQNSNGTVIQYENNFYYIYLWQNYNLKYSDGIRIHKLGANAADENILIRYLPESYVWKNVYNKVDFEGELESYINNIKSKIISDKYLENGMQTEIDVYFGDEAAGKDTCKDAYTYDTNSADYCKIDFANIGIPIYMRKSNFIPSNGLRWHSRVKFYLYDTEKDLFMELENMELGYTYFPPFPPDMELVQIWYKEIKQKILTFRVYHIFDYNYVLNVLLIEGDKVTQIREDIFSPKYKFTLTEGTVFHTG